MLSEAINDISTGVEEFVIKIPAKAEIKAFEPSKFIQLQIQAGISLSDLIHSLAPVNNREQIFKSNKITSNGESSNVGGSSGSFFFFSQDRQYIIKTITKKEIDSLIKLLPSLVDQYSENLKSYLALIVGIFEIKLQGFSKVNVIVMKNCVQQTSEMSKILYKFDLKGSKLNR